jgi:hypothetical protein
MKPQIDFAIQKLRFRKMARSGLAIAAFTLVIVLFFSARFAIIHSPRLHALPPAQFSDSQCKETYAKFYEKDQLDFRIVFGYKDARPARLVGDRYERAYLMQKLLDYGFTRSLDNAEVLLYQRLGVDGRPKKIRLTLVASSVGPDDNENRRDPFQKWSSAHAEETFLNGLHGADLVFYYGHSRDGGGPDFTPPRLTRDGHTDYLWYKKNKPGVKKMVAALEKSTTGPQVLGLYSCVSDRWFTHILHQLKPNMALMVSHSLLYYIDALNGMLETLKSLLEMKCQADFHPPGTKAVNFFEAQKR